MAETFGSNGCKTDMNHWVQNDADCPGPIRSRLEQHSPPGAAQRSRPPRRRRADAAAAPRAPSCRSGTRKLSRHQSDSLERFIVLGQGQQQLRQAGCVGYSTHPDPAALAATAFPNPPLNRNELANPSKAAASQIQPCRLKLITPPRKALTLQPDASRPP